MQMKTPTIFVVPEHATPPLQEIVIDDDAAKPFVVNATVVPTGPEGRLSESCCTTVNDTVADPPCESVPENG